MRYEFITYFGGEGGRGSGTYHSKLIQEILGETAKGGGGWLRGGRRVGAKLDNRKNRWPCYGLNLYLFVFFQR
jgi:hypothetical protein